MTALLTAADGSALARSPLAQRTRTGELHLTFEQRGGRTVLLRDRQKAPLMIVRPFELPCGTLMVFIVNPTGGVLGGDHNEIRVEVGPGARALLLTQSATRVQPSPGGAVATQHLHLSVQEGGRLEVYPERTIPFAGSRFHQLVRAELRGNAELGLTETLASGRVLRGERLAFGEYRNRTEVWRDGQRVYLDQQTLSPGAESRAPGVWGTHDFMASGVWLGAPSRRQTGDGPTPAPRLLVDSQTTPGELALGQTPSGAVWLRAVASSGPTLDERLSRVREHLRSQLFGAARLQIRRSP